MSENKPKIGDIVICDDAGNGKIKDFVFGAIAEIDIDNSYGNEELYEMYRVEWSDVDTNPEVDEWFSLQDLQDFVNTYNNFTKGLYEQSV